MLPPSLLQDRRPLYQIVAESLIAAIQRGEHPVGSELPSETALCARFNVSRNTVREAVRLMEQAGLVSRRQGIGTRVERDSINQQYIQTLASISDLGQYVRETKRRVLGIEDVAAAAVDIPLPGRDDALWRRLEALRYVEDAARPVAWTQVFLPTAYGEVLNRLDDAAALICSLVEAHFGITTQSIRQEIRALEIAAPVAKLLNVRPKSAGLAMLRQYVSDKGETYEVTWSIHPANRYKYVMEMVRSFAPSGKL
jgi:DNA-binding GntR family transcriptional regulator